MALETGTYTNDLVTSNPVAADGLNQGDDHIRLIKSTLKNTFSGFTSVALASSQSQLDAAVAAVAGSTALPFKVGTVALPGLFPLGNANTGIYSPATNQIGISVGGVASVLFSGSGIGVTGNATVSGGIVGAVVSSTGAYSGGTGQLVPIGSELIWNEDTLPAEGGYCWANGGTLTRAGNPILWTRWGTKYGAGDGSTTFNVPNHCEVALVGQRAMGAAASRSLFATGVLGAGAYGEAAHLLTSGEMPSHYHAAGISDPGHAHSYTMVTNAGNTGSGGAFGNSPLGSTTSSAATGVRVNSSNGLDTTYSTGGGAAHNNVQPSTTVNFIIRIG